MASLIEELLTTLTTQHQLYEEMLILSEEKLSTIKNNDINLLQQITAAETAIIGKNQRLETKRVDLVKNIGIVLNKSPGELTLTNIAEIINSNVESKEILALRDKLKITLEALKEKNEQNKLLIQSSLDYIDFSVNLLRDQGDNPYAFGQNTLQNGKNFFDAKQ